MGKICNFQCKPYQSLCISNTKGLVRFTLKITNFCHLQKSFRLRWSTSRGCELRFHFGFFLTTSPRSELFGKMYFTIWKCDFRCLKVHLQNGLGIFPEGLIQLLGERDLFWRFGAPKTMKKKIHQNYEKSCFYWHWKVYEVIIFMILGSNSDFKIAQ